MGDGWWWVVVVVVVVVVMVVEASCSQLALFLQAQIDQLRRTLMHDSPITCCMSNGWKEHVLTSRWYVRKNPHDSVSFTLSPGTAPAAAAAACAYSVGEKQSAWALCPEACKWSHIYTHPIHAIRQVRFQINSLATTIQINSSRGTTRGCSWKKLIPAELRFQLPFGDHEGSAIQRLPRGTKNGHK